jgi:hypothetical protein
MQDAARRDALAADWDSDDTLKSAETGTPPRFRPSGASHFLLQVPCSAGLCAASLPTACQTARRKHGRATPCMPAQPPRSIHQSSAPPLTTPSHSPPYPPHHPTPLTTPPHSPPHPPHHPTPLSALSFLFAVHARSWAVAYWCGQSAPADVLAAAAIKSLSLAGLNPVTRHVSVSVRFSSHVLPYQSACVGAPSPPLVEASDESSAPVW